MNKRKKTARTKAKKSPAKRSKAVKVRKDPIAEYREAIAKQQVLGDDGKMRSALASVGTLSDSDCLANVLCHVSTQSLALDRILNGKGIPTGRVTEIFGQEHIGKSTLLDHIFAQVQKMGGIAILAEPEGGRDEKYTTRIGANPDKLQYLRFARNQFYLENILEVFYTTIDFWRTHYFDTPVVIGLDALGGTSIRAEMEGTLTASKSPGAAAKVIREAARKIPVRLGNTNIALVICNHEYEKIVTYGGGVGPKRITYGGGGLRHLASLRLSLFFSKGAFLKNADQSVYGQVVTARTVKNRLGTPWQETNICMIPGVGVNNVWTLYDELKRARLIEVAGSWGAVNIDGEITKFQGWQGLQRLCEKDPSLFSRLVSVYQTLCQGGSNENCGD